MVLTQHRLLLFKQPSTSWVSSLWKRDGGGRSWPVPEESIFRLGKRGCELKDIRRVMAFHGSSRISLIVRDPASKTAGALGVVLRLSGRDEAHSLKALIVQLARVASRKNYLPKQLFPNTGSHAIVGTDQMTSLALGNFVKESHELTRSTVIFQYMRVKVLGKNPRDGIFTVAFDPYSRPGRDESSKGYIFVLDEKLDEWWFSTGANADSALGRHIHDFFVELRPKMRAISSIQYISLSQSAEPSMILFFETQTSKKDDALSLLFTSTEARQCAFLSVVSCFRRFA